MGERKWNASSPAELADLLAGDVAAARAGGSFERAAAMTNAARHLRASRPGAPILMCGARVGRAEHVWLECDGWWADPVGAAEWGGPAAGPAHTARKAEWKETYVSKRRCKLSGAGVP